MIKSHYLWKDDDFRTTYIDNWETKMMVNSTSLFYIFLKFQLCDSIN